MVTVNKSCRPDMDEDSPYYGEYTYFVVRDGTYIALTYSENLANSMAKALNGDEVERNTLSSRKDDIVNNFGCLTTFVLDGTKIVAVILKDTDAEAIMAAYKKP